MSIKSIIVCASALVFGICGCDNGSDVASSSGIATGPRAVEGSLVSAGFAKAPIDRVLGDKKAEFYANIKKDMPEDFKDSLSKAGLDDIEVTWGGISLVDVTFDESGAPSEKVPEIVIALAFDHDFDKLSAVLKEEAAREGSPKTRDATYLGEKGLVLFDDDMTIALGSVAGKILVAGTSEAAAERGVGLYRDGKGGKALVMDASTLVKAFANALGERVVTKLPAEATKDALAPSVEDATALLQGLKDFSATISATDDNGVDIVLKLDTASGDDAAKLAKFANDNIAATKAMMTLMAMQDPSAKPTADALNALSVATDGATVTAKLTLPGDTFKQVSEKALD